MQNSQKKRSGIFVWGFRLWHIFLHLLPTVPDAPALATWTGQRDFCRKLEFTNAVTPDGRLPIICSDSLLFDGMTDNTFLRVFFPAWFRELCLNSVDGIVLAAHCTSMMFTP